VRELGREGFLTADELLTVLRRLAEAQVPVTLGRTRGGALSLEETGGALVARLGEHPAFQLSAATLRGGWCTAPNAATDCWLIDVDLHGDGCEMLVDRLRFMTFTQLTVPP
jgi:hypothetical protein